MARHEIEKTAQIIEERLELIEQRFQINEDKLTQLLERLELLKGALKKYEP